MEPSEEASPSQPDYRQVLAVCFVLFFATFALFSPAIHHGFLDYDDPGYVTHNLHVQRGFTPESVRWAFTTGYAANWHPLTWLSLTLDWNLFGNDARGFHATNIFWHSLSAVMVFLTFRRMTAAFWTSALAAAIFAWHPLRVESVTWISERKDVLSVFFGLLSLWAYAGYAQRRRDGRHGIGYYLFTLVSLAVGLLCKPTLVTLPCLMLVLDFWPLRRNARKLNIGPLILEKIPFFALAATSSAVTYHVQKAGGAMVETIPLTARLANAAISVVRYLHKFFWPFDLAVCYPYPHQWPRWFVGASVMVIVLITALALLQRKRRPWILVGWLWYLGTLVPVVGIVQVGLQSLADRYTYLPLLGVELALLWTLREIRCPIRAPWLKPAVAGAILAGLAVRTWDQSADWETPRKLYEHALAVTDDNYLAECFLGSVYFGENDFKEAGVHFQRAIDFKPDYAVAQYRLGLVLDKLGDHSAAMAQYDKVLQLKSDDPMAHYSLGVDLLDRNAPAAAISDFQVALQEKDDFNRSSTYLAMGMAYARMNQPRQAIDSYQQAIALDPQNAEAHYDYANLLASMGQNPQALAEYDQATQLNPTFAKAYRNQGNLLRKMGRPADAADKYRRAIALDPNSADALYGLGQALEDLGNPADAAGYYEQAVHISPGLADAQYNLGVLLLNGGHPDLALPHFQSAANAEPTDDAAFLGLGISQGQLGNRAAAVQSLQRAIAMNPGNADAHYYLGLTLHSMGHDDQAIDQWRQTLKINPDYPNAADLIAKAQAEMHAPAATNP